MVAGTHGKTTTSALLTHLLASAGRDPSALIGGVSLNLLETSGTGNFRIGKGRHFVIEGDEYDTAYFDKGPKFMHYRPKRAVLTSIEFDHGDIYRDLAHYESAFARFLALLPKHGHLAVAAANSGAGARAERLAELAECRVETYGIEHGDLQADELEFARDGAHFDLTLRGTRLGAFFFPIFGKQNVENALGASSVALAVGLNANELRAGLASFRGVRRRQELLGTPGKVSVFDDFAHHPTAVRATLAAMRTRFPQARLFALFEPRSNTSRRKISEHDYAKAFELATRVGITAPQGGSPIPDDERLDPAALAHAIADTGKEAQFFATVAAAVETVGSEARAGDVVLIMSNGSFGGLAKKMWERREPAQAKTLPPL